MADSLQRVGLVFKADGAVDFRKSLTEVNNAVQENRNSFKLAKIQWNENTTAMEKLEAQQEYLAKQTVAYTQKIDVLDKELRDLENAEKRNEQAIKKKKNQLDNAKLTLASYEKGLKEVTAQITSGSAEMEEEMKKLDGNLNTLSEAAKENQSAFGLVKTEWEEGTKKAKKLKDEQSFLVSQTQNYEKQVEALEKQLSLLENAEERNEKAISAKKSQLNQTKAELNDYEKQLEEVNTKLKTGSEQLEEYADKTQKFGKQMTDAGKKMTTGVTTPITGAGVAAGKLAIDFENSMAKVSTIADTTKTPIDDLKTGIMELSNETGQSASELSEAMYQAISASVDTEKSVEFLSTAVKAAVGGFTDNATAVDGLTSVLNSYGLEAEYVDKVANQMLITQNLGKTTFGELANSIGQVTPVAASLGVTTEELLSSLAVTTAQGLGTSESITALKAAMSNIIKPSKEAADAAEALGIDFSVSALQSKGWIGFLKDVREGLGKAVPEYEKLAVSVENGTKQLKEMEDAGKKNTEEYKKLKKEVKSSSKELELLTQANDSTIGGFATMFGSVEGLNSVLMLTSEQGMQKYNEAMSEMENNTMALQEAYDKMNKTPGMQMQKAMNDIKNAGIEIGDNLLPIISEFVSGIRDIVKRFSELDEAQQDNIIKVASLIAAIGPLLVVFGSVFGGISKIIGGSKSLIGLIVKGGPSVVDVFKTVGVGAKDLWAIMAANPIGAVITVIGILISAFVAAYYKCEWFRNGVDKIFKEVVEFFKDVGKKFKETGEDIVDFFKGLGKKIGDFFSFKWLDIKLPHLKISGDFSLVPPRVPKLSVKWYAKGGILNKPTLFGQNGGELMGGGEAGPEAVLPIKLLREYIREENKINNESLVTAFIEALKTLNISPDVNVYIGDGKLTKVLAGEVTKIIGNGQKERMRAMGLT